MLVLLTILNLIGPAVAATMESEKTYVYAHYAKRAVERNDLHALRVVLDIVPRPDVLRPGGGSILLSLYRSFLRADDASLPELKDLLVQTIWKGADPLERVKLRGIAPDSGQEQSAVAHILEEWSASAKSVNAEIRARIHARSAIFFDHLFAERCLDPNATIDVQLKSKVHCLMPIAQWAPVQNELTEIFDYFLKVGFLPLATNQIGDTVSMMLAIRGDVQGLQNFRERFGPKRTADAFNQINSDVRPMSTLHFALLSLVIGNTAVDEVESMLEFLCASGADPDPVTLRDEPRTALAAWARFNADRYPARRESFQALGHYCEMNLPRLKKNAKNYLTASCAVELLGQPTIH